MSRHPIGDQAMTDAERQARYRAAHAAGAPVLRIRRPAERADRWMQHRSASRPDHRGRARRWNDSVATLLELQPYYAAWLDNLPDNLHDSATGEALQAIVELDLDALAAVQPPRGFGRD
jgi:urease accessory protein UreF